MTILKRYNGSDWEAIAVGQKGDSGVGVPTGGTTDQVLAKVSATDYDTAWVTLNYVDAAGAVSAIKADADWNATDWDTAYGWGDHAVAGYALSSSLGTIASQDADSVNIDGGAIDATDIGVTTPATVSSDNYLTADNYPTIKPSLNLDFANTKTLDPRVTFARASTATYYDGQTVAKAEENLLTYSEDFTNPSWSKTNTTVTSDQTQSPSGTLTADLVTATSDAFSVVRKFTSISSGDNVCSIYAKAGTASSIEFYVLEQGIISGTATINLSNGAVSSVNTFAWTGGVTAIDVGNGWYRIVGVRTFVNAAANHSFGVSVTGQNGNTFYIWGAQLEQRDSVTAYTPTTTQPITNYIPVLQTASSGDPRFDHDPITGESKGLLIEEQRTNLLLRSEEFNLWTNGSTRIVANSIVAPDGNLSADKLFATTSSTYQNVNRVLTKPSGESTFTVYAKAGELSWLSIQLLPTSPNDFSNNSAAYFDLANGAVGTTLRCSAKITHVGNEWYRCELTTTQLSSSASSLLQPILGVTSADNTVNSSGNGYSGIYIWGAQLEEGSFPTSYIKTEGSQVTRVADSASMTGTNFSDWYRQDEGTLFLHGASLLANTGYRGFTLNSNTSNNYHILGGREAITVSNGTSQVNIVTTTVPANEFNKSAYAYAVNNFAYSFDGSTPSIDTSGLLPNNIDRAGIGNITTPTQFAGSGHIKKIAYYPQRLSNLELVALTEE